MIHGAPHTIRGFTLIETLVAIAILVVAVAAPLTLATQGLSAALVARDQITAFYLGQEAIEYVRNKRDENALRGDAWLSGLGACVGRRCTVDVTEDRVNGCSGTCPPIRYDESTSFYTYVNGDDTLFTRTVEITSINADEVEIEVTMSWQNRFVPRTFVIKEHIFNWQQGFVSGP